MAEVSNLRRCHPEKLLSSSPATLPSGGAVAVAVAFEAEEEEEPLPDIYAFDLDSLSPPPPHHSFTINDNFNSTANAGPESESVHSYQNFFCYDPEDDGVDQMNLVTDLFATRQGIPGEQGNFEFGFGCTDGESELVLDLEPDCNRVAPVSSMGGLRIVDMESESDSEAVEIDSRVDSVSNLDGADRNDDFVPDGFWDCLQIDSFNEEFEWEEVNYRENLSSLIDRIEELSVSSDGEISPFDSGDEEEGEENARNAEWQFLLAVNNPELAIGFDDYNVLFEELVEAETTVKGSPPAAKSVLENLPLVFLTREDLTVNNVVCAVCKDEISLEVEVIRLPCRHHYHEDCIYPWLRIHNTCPLCRYELPTDDMDYERRKNGNGGGGGGGGGSGSGASRIDDSQVRYSYQILP